eukprot:366167-Chlamydomonas_euryale.AAC.8
MQCDAVCMQEDAERGRGQGAKGQTLDRCQRQRVSSTGGAEVWRPRGVDGLIQTCSLRTVMRKAAKLIDK